MQIGYEYLLLAAAAILAFMPKIGAWWSLATLGGAIALAVAVGRVTPIILVWVALLGCATWIASGKAVPAFGAATPVLIRRIGMAIALLTGLAMAMHVLPGFNNPKVVDAVTYGATSAPFTLYLNFDKGIVGVLLVAIYCATRQQKLTGSSLSVGVAFIVITPLVVMLVGSMLGYVHWDSKVLPYLQTYLFANLFLTCIAEEAFFRGLIQGGLQATLNDKLGASKAGWIAVAVAALIFGLAHAAGGPLLVVLAILAGGAYGAVYLLTGRIELAVLTHFSVNVMHALFFTFPYFKAPA